MSQPQPDADAPRPHGALTDAESVDVEALLDQATQLAQDAAGQAGVELDPAAASRPIDIESPPVGTTLVDDQVAEVESLVAQANTDAARWAATPDPLDSADAKPVDTPDAAQADSADASRFAIAESTERRAEVTTEPQVVDDVATVAASQAAAGVASAPAEAPPTESAESPAEPDADVRAASRVKGAFVATARIPVGLMLGGLGLLNKPFAGANDITRRVAGWIALGTLATAALVWLIPLLQRAFAR